MLPGPCCHRAWLRMQRRVSMHRVRRLQRAPGEQLPRRDLTSLVPGQLTDSRPAKHIWPHVTVTAHRRGGALDRGQLTLCCAILTDAPPACCCCCVRSSRSSAQRNWRWHWRTRTRDSSPTAPAGGGGARQARTPQCVSASVYRARCISCLPFGCGRPHDDVHELYDCQP
jgi:hypothetical protein